MAAPGIATELREALSAVEPVLPTSRLLLVALEPIAIDELGAIAARACAYSLPLQLKPVSAPGSAASTHAPWLPYDDGAFDIVLLYRLTSHSVAIALLLGEAARVLRPTGKLLMIERPDDFSFAPLPDSGASHLLHQWLREAGFAGVNFMPQTPTRLVAVAHL